MEEDKLEGTPLIAPSTTEHNIYESVVEACKSVYDTEIPDNIYELGLIYKIEIDKKNNVKVDMTLTCLLYTYTRQLDS